MALISIPRVTAALAVVALAVGCSGKAPSQRTADAGQLLARAVAQQQSGHLAESKALFAQLVAAQPTSAVAHYDYGTLLQQQGDDVDALSQYALALAIDPNNVQSLYNSATIYGVTNPALAITTYRRVIQLQPKSPTALLNVGLLEVGTALDKQGVADLREALTQDPTLVSRLPPGVKAEVAASKPSP